MILWSFAFVVGASISATAFYPQLVLWMGRVKFFLVMHGLWILICLPSSMGGRCQGVHNLIACQEMKCCLVMLMLNSCSIQIFRKEPFFYGHDNYDQLVKIAKVCMPKESSRSVLYICFIYIYMVNLLPLCCSIASCTITLLAPISRLVVFCEWNTLP